MHDSITALLIEDNPGDVTLLRAMLSDEFGNGLGLEAVNSLSQGLARVAQADVDIVLLDLTLTETSGLQTFRSMYRQVPTVPIIVLTGLDDKELAIQAVREGAQDYLVKGHVNRELLLRAMRYAIERKRIQEALYRANEELEERVAERTAELSSANARLRQEMAERLQLENRLAAVHRLGQELVLLHDDTLIARRVLETAAGVLPCDLVGCGLVDEAAGELVYAHHRVDGMWEVPQARLPLDGERGIGVAVVRSGRALYLPDAASDPRYVPIFDRPAGSELCVPMVVGERIIGVLNAESASPGRFTAGDQQLLQTLANQAAVALENARLYASVHARAIELETLYDLGLTLTSTLDSGVVIETALAQVQRLFEADSVLWLDATPPSGELSLSVALVRTTFVDPPPVPSSGQGVTGWVAQHRQAVRVEDAQADPRLSCLLDEPLGTRTRSLMVAPLIVTGRILGQVVVTSSRTAAYTPEDLRTLEAVAFALAVALENARLYEEQKALLREREQTQAQLIHSEKMAALGRLTASIAHEINNPLQSVQVCLNLAEEELADEQGRDRLERYLSLASSEIARVGTIVHRMRDFYRPARQGKELADVQATLDAVLALSNKQLQHSNVETVCEWADLPLIEANVDHLKQVFLNLVLNAVDAMPGGGTLRVRTRLDTMEGPVGEPSVPAVCIEFSDTGLGMHDEVLSRLFEPFFTTKADGSGLGLFVTFGIIESHHGQIAVDSRPGEGTTFTIRLPLEQPGDL